MVNSFSTYLLFLIALFSCNQEKQLENQFNIEKYYIESIIRDINQDINIIKHCHALNEERYGLELSTCNRLEEFIEIVIKGNNNITDDLNAKIDSLLSGYSEQRFGKKDGKFFLENHITNLNINYVNSNDRKLCGILKLKNAIYLLAFNSCTSELDMDMKPQRQDWEFQKHLKN